MNECNDCGNGLNMIFFCDFLLYEYQSFPKSEACIEIWNIIHFIYLLGMEHVAAKGPRRGDWVCNDCHFECVHFSSQWTQSLCAGSFGSTKLPTSIPIKELEATCPCDINKRSSYTFPIERKTDELVMCRLATDTALADGWGLGVIKG